jgi:hypothetical protein
MVGLCDVSQMWRFSYAASAVWTDVRRPPELVLHDQGQCSSRIARSGGSRHGGRQCLEALRRMRSGRMRSGRVFVGLIGTAIEEEKTGRETPCRMNYYSRKAVKYDAVHKGNGAGAIGAISNKRT